MSIFEQLINTINKYELENITKNFEKLAKKEKLNFWEN
jgi:hypothetical protein